MNGAKVRKGKKVWDVSSAKQSLRGFFDLFVNKKGMSVLTFLFDLPYETGKCSRKKVPRSSRALGNSMAQIGNLSVVELAIQHSSSKTQEEHNQIQQGK